MNRYPTLYCIHCQLMRCFPGGAETCYEWPGSWCPPPVPEKLILSGDGSKWWDGESRSWKNFESGVDSLWYP